MRFYFGRCPACRCTRVHRSPDGWAEASILGWTIGIYRDYPR